MAVSYAVIIFTPMNVHNWGDRSSNTQRRFSDWRSLNQKATQFFGFPLALVTGTLVSLAALKYPIGGGKND